MVAGLLLCPFSNRPVYIGYGYGYVRTYNAFLYERTRVEGEREGERGSGWLGVRRFTIAIDGEHEHSSSPLTQTLFPCTANESRCFAKMSRADRGITFADK